MRVDRRLVPPSKPWAVRAAAEAILTMLEQTDRGAPLAGFGTLVDEIHMARTEYLLLGKHAGDETWLLSEMAGRGLAIILGGDQQATEEAHD